MRKPQKLPSVSQLMQKIIEEDPQKVFKLYQFKPTDYKGRYLHWNELKYRQPPTGFSTEEYWLGTKLARLALQKDLPLFDAEGKPFKFGMPDSVLKMLHQIDRDASGEIKIAQPVLNMQTRDMYLVKSLIEEAINSSQLEGASTTRIVAKQMLHARRKPRNRSEQMVYNNFQAMEFVRENKNEPLTPAMVCELHEIVTENTLSDSQAAGKFREVDDQILVVDMASEQILHTPPTAAELPERLQRVCDFANQDDSELFIHPIIRAILLHFMLAYDHPFVDGNGRTARALFYWSMARQGYWLIEFTSISKILKEAPAKYGYAFLYSETDENDTTYFIIHQLHVILRAIEALQNYLARKMIETRQTIELLAQSKLAGELNHRQITLLEHALKNPNTAYRIREHQTLHGVTYQTARTDFMQLADELNLLLRLKDGRTFVYLSPVDLRERIEATR